MTRSRTLKRIYATATVPILAVGLALAAVAYVNAQENNSFTADLQVLNDSGSTGTATATLDGNQLTIEIESSGLVPNAPHAQHLHIGGTNMCPDMSADTNGDGVLTTTEGQPSYGPIRVSLTTTGDVTDASGLAVDRFPSADANGNLSYSRTFELPAGVTAADIPNAVVVQHGVDSDASGTYDGPGSDLDPAVPLEATLPANCGPHEDSAGGSAVASPTTGAGGAGGASTSPTPASGLSAPDTGFGPEDGGASDTTLIGSIALGAIALVTVGFAISRVRAG